MKVIRIVPNIASERFDESRDFYAELFDVVVSVEMDWYLQLMSPDDPSLNIGFVKPGGGLSAGPVASPGSSPVVVTVHVDDVDAAYERAQSAGAPLVADIRDEEYGQRHFVVTDPNGVHLNVMSAI